MAKIRKFAAYRRLDARPYTRISKFRKLAYVRAKPHSKLAKFEMGDSSKTFEEYITLSTKIPVQIRHNALEAARQTCNKHLETDLGKGNYHFKVVSYPHHILRENPLASGAGADRMSTGMKSSFGKSVGVAARKRKNQTIFKVGVSKEHVKACKKALKVASTKLPCGCTIEIKK